MAQVPLVGRLDFPLYLPPEAIQYGAMLLEVMDRHARDDGRFEVTGAFWGLRTCDGLSWDLFFVLRNLVPGYQAGYEVVFKAVDELGKPPELPPIHIEPDNSRRMETMRSMLGDLASERVNRWTSGWPSDDDIFPAGYIYRC